MERAAQPLDCSTLKVVTNAISPKETGSRKCKGPVWREGAQVGSRMAHAPARKDDPGKTIPNEVGNIAWIFAWQPENRYGLLTLVVISRSLAKVPIMSVAFVRAVQPPS
jgi:hypothetical protein